MEKETKGRTCNEEVGGRQTGFWKRLLCVLIITKKNESVT